MLSALGVVGVGGLAGCLGDDSDSGDSDSGDSDSGDSDSGDSDSGDSDSDVGEETEPVTDTFTVHTDPAQQLERVGFNSWNPTTDYLGWLSWVSGDPSITYNVQEAQYEPFVIGDWDISEESITWTLNDEYDYKWDTGEPLTAHDFVANTEIHMGMFGGETTYVSDAEALSDDEFEYTLVQPANSEIMLSDIILSPVYSHGPMGDFAERFTDATTQDELDSISEELQEFEIIPDKGDHVPSYGPFKLDEVEESYYTATANEHHPQYDNLNFDTIEALQTPERSAVQAMLQAGNLDHGWSRFPNTFLDRLPDKYEVWEKLAFGGNSIDFQLTSDLYGDREIRQAYNHILDKEAMVEAVDFNQVPDRYTTGMPDHVAESWIGEETLANFTDYSGRNEEEATELLESIGYQRDDGTWYTPEGEEWTVTLTAPAGDIDRVNQIDIATDMLEDFGVNAEMNTIEVATYWQRYRERDWDIAIWAYGARHSPHPYFDFMHQFRGADPDEPRPSPEQKPWAGTPYELEVPGTIGDPNSSMETFEFRQLIEELGVTQDRERAQEIITTLGWIYNQFVFKVPIALETQPNVMNQEDWEYPSEEEYYHRFRGQIPWSMMMSEGVIQAREE